MASAGPADSTGLPAHVEIANQGAGELRYRDLGALWRAHYDMPPEALLAEYERLWKQVEPLYLALHCHARARLREKYGDLVPERGSIPAHLLGDMWAQQWTGIEALVGPGGSGRAIDITRLLKEKNYDPRRHGFDRRAVLYVLTIREAARKVLAAVHVCQAGRPTLRRPGIGLARRSQKRRRAAEDGHRSHGEGSEDDLPRAGTLYYFLAYADQPFLFQESPNPGFHEAVGDAIALSITPEYLSAIGLLDRVPPEDEDLSYLFHTALDRIPRLAMAIVVDTWRWKVFSGEIPPERDNAEWWALRRKYQGVSPPSTRTEEDFDAGMFYHVSHNIPYDRYFTALLLQFDFHRALCEAAGHSGSLHRGSIYGSRKAGQRLREALALGASRPWPDVLEQLTGERQLNASSLVEYFAPVMAWLNQPNRGRQVGW